MNVEQQIQDLRSQFFKKSISSNEFRMKCAILRGEVQDETEWNSLEAEKNSKSLEEQAVQFGSSSSKM